MGGATEIKAIIESLIGKRHTITLVEVVKVYDSDDLAAVGFVDIKPMVQMIDGANNVYERGVITKAPYFRLQGGGNALIVNPKSGDIGLAAFCERDISMVKRTRKSAAPNTRRQFSLNDAVYFGGFLNGVPSQYIQFLESGINIKSTGNININGVNISPSGIITLSNGVVLDTHVHAQGNDSAGNTEQPTGVPQ